MPDFNLDAVLQTPQEDHFLVDFKWNAWTSPDEWEELEPEAWKRISSLLPNEEVEIQSSPRKIGYFARAVISRSGSGHWHADGIIASHWDEPEELLGCYDLPDDAFDAFVAELPRLPSGEIGVYAEFHENSPSVERLMVQVADIEGGLNERDASEGATVEAWATQWKREHEAARRRWRQTRA